MRVTFCAQIECSSARPRQFDIIIDPNMPQVTISWWTCTVCFWSICLYLTPPLQYLNIVISEPIRYVPIHPFCEISSPMHLPCLRARIWQISASEGYSIPLLWEQRCPQDLLKGYAMPILNINRLMELTEYTHGSRFRQRNQCSRWRHRTPDRQRYRYCFRKYTPHNLR